MADAQDSKFQKRPFHGVSLHFFPNVKILVNTGENAFFPAPIGAEVSAMKVAQKVAQTTQFE